MWGITLAGKRAPIDTDPVAGGNVRLSRDEESGQLRAMTLGGALLEKARTEGVELHLNHFATCPNRRRHARGEHSPPVQGELDVA